MPFAGRTWEGLIALMITPILTASLNPGAPDDRLLLFKNPFSSEHQAIYLNSFLPHWIHSVGTLFSVSILVIFIGKGVAEFFWQRPGAVCGDCGRHGSA